MRNYLFGCCLLLIYSNGYSSPIVNEAIFNADLTYYSYEGGLGADDIFDSARISAASISELKDQINNYFGSLPVPLGGTDTYVVSWEANFPFTVTNTNNFDSHTEYPYYRFSPEAYFISPETNIVSIANGGLFSGSFVGYLGGDGSDEYYFDVSVCTTKCVPAVPIPSAVWLFGSGLLGLIGLARRKQQSLGA